jgi:hypothetical protein
MLRTSWVGLEMPRHLHHFTPQTLGRLLAAEGFRITAFMADPFYWTLQASVTRILTRCLGREIPHFAARALYYALMPAGLALRFIDMSNIEVRAVRLQSDDCAATKRDLQRPSETAFSRLLAANGGSGADPDAAARRRKRS